jgi:hypothetical protein
MAISFKDDIAPMFAPYRANMMWRFDITDYETVKASASLIYARITGNSIGNQMPPSRMEPLSEQQQNLFQQWMTDGFLP